MMQSFWLVVKDLCIPLEVTKNYKTYLYDFMNLENQVLHSR